MYNVAIIDADVELQEKLKQAITAESCNCEVVSTARTGEAFTLLSKTSLVDIIIADVILPDGNALELLVEPITENVNLHLVLFTESRDFDSALRAIELGVSAYILKPADSEKIEKLVTELSKIAAMLDKTIGNRSVRDGDNTGFIVRTASAFIEEHHTEKITLLQVAQACHISQWHLSKMLSKNGGRSFYDLLNSSRLAHAKQLLKNPALHIHDISGMVGYADASHFSRVFRKMEGKSISKFRNNDL